MGRQFLRSESAPRACFQRVVARTEVRLLGLGSRGGVSGGAAASEFEPQQPASRVGLVCWSEPPFSGGFSCLAGEIPAWPRVFQQRVDDIARVVDDHEHRDPDAAVNGVTCAARNVGNLCMHYGGL